MTTPDKRSELEKRFCDPEDFLSMTEVIELVKVLNEIDGAHHGRLRARRDTSVATKTSEGTNLRQQATNRPILPVGGKVTPPSVASPSLQTGAQSTARRELDRENTNDPDSN